MEYSLHQINIFKSFKHTNSNLIITAVAGSGKTTTLLKLLQYSIKLEQTSIFLAFNKSIVNELKSKIPLSIDISTFHSFGYSILQKNLKSLLLSKDKNKQISKKYGIKIDPKKEYDIFKMVDLYRLNLCESYEDLLDLLKIYPLDIEKHINTVYTIIQCIEDYNITNIELDNFIIDFVDMVYLVAINDFDIDYYDNIFIDESQDMNKCQHVMLEKLLNAKNRFIAVGDPNQSIYGFLGADKNSYNLLKEYNNTIELPLSYCYRCGSEITKYANSIYDVMISPNNIHKGSVSFITDDDILAMERTKKWYNSTIILSRYNALLAKIYLKLKDENIPCYIKGKETWDDILYLIYNIKEQTLKGIESSLYKKLNQIMIDLTSIGFEKPQESSLYITFVDKIQIIKTFITKSSSKEELINNIKNSYTNEYGIALMTIHRSKGLEANNVYIYGYNLLPSEFAKSEYEIDQEHNLKYVALTRAKNNLFLINTNSPFNNNDI